MAVALFMSRVLDISMAVLGIRDPQNHIVWTSVLCESAWNNFARIRTHRRQFRVPDIDSVRDRPSTPIVILHPIPMISLSAKRYPRRMPPSLSREHQKLIIIPPCVPDVNSELVLLRPI